MKIGLIIYQRNRSGKTNYECPCGPRNLDKGYMEDKQEELYKKKRRNYAKSNNIAMKKFSTKLTGD